MNQKKIPIVVDLDGTLILTDSLHELIIKLLHISPAKIFTLLYLMFVSKAKLKEYVSTHASLNPKLLPYNLELINWLEYQKKQGATLVLATGANKKVADAIAQHLGLFELVISSNSHINMTSNKKRDELIKRFGVKGYDYVGNSNADLPVWKDAEASIVVNASKMTHSRAVDTSNVVKTFPAKKVTFNCWRRVFRAHQYLKNLLIFIPLIAAHQYGNVSSIENLIYALFSFCLSASAVYITNDLIDLDSDRQHPRKRTRPFASCTVPISTGLLLAPICLLLSVTLASQVNLEFAVCLLVYLILTAAYSFRLKQYILIDCLTLAALYTLRIIAGAAAVAIPLSFWLLAFSIFLFLSLAFVKRYSELHVQALEGNSHAIGRGYYVGDQQIIQTFGITAGYTSVLILALYLNSDKVIKLYQAPEIIWLSVPIILFWISWIWMKAHRGQMNDDPVVFAIKDKVSLLVGFTFITTFAFARVWSA